VIPISKFGVKSIVNINVIIATIASCFSIFHAFIIGEIFMRFHTATIIIAASVASGRWYKNGVKNNNVIPTNIPVTIDENHVFAPALRFTAVFEKDPATPYQPNKLELIFANHCHISSLFAETLRLV